MASIHLASPANAGVPCGCRLVKRGEHLSGRGWSELTMGRAIPQDRNKLCCYLTETGRAAVGAMRESGSTETSP
jgi:hypothetical protein